MLLELAVFAAICLIVLLANLARKDAETMAAPVVSMEPYSRFDRLWRVFATLCRHLDLQPGARFAPRDPVHQVAALLMFVVVLCVLGLRSRVNESGGIGLLPTDPTVALLHAMATCGFYLALALLGVGWLTRRNFAAVLQRLELRLPNRRDWLEGLSLALALFLLSQAGIALWARSVPPHDFEMQTMAAHLIFEAFNGTLASSILLALASALGEEVLFRGALQPVFGIVTTSLFFALLHSQYLFTPAMLILFVLSLCFGWLRNRRGVSAVIICHAAYNLLPFLIHRFAG